MYLDLREFFKEMNKICNEVYDYRITSCCDMDVMTIEIGYALVYWAIDISFDKEERFTVIPPEKQLDNGELNGYDIETIGKVISLVDKYEDILKEVFYYGLR